MNQKIVVELYGDDSKIIREALYEYVHTRLEYWSQTAENYTHFVGLVSTSYAFEMLEELDNLADKKYVATLWSEMLDMRQLFADEHGNDEPF